MVADGSGHTAQPDLHLLVVDGVAARAHRGELADERLRLDDGVLGVTFQARLDHLAHELGRLVGEERLAYTGAMRGSA